MIVIRPRSSKDIPRWLSKHSQIQTSLVKIEIGVVFWFENDLSLVDNKNTPNNIKDVKRWECQQWTTKQQQVIVRVLKTDAWNTKSVRLNMKIFFLKNRGHQKCWGLHLGMCTLGLKTCYIFSNKLSLGSMVKRHWGILDFLLRQWEAPKRPSLKINN